MSFYKVTINSAGRKEEVYDTMVALKERRSTTHYGSELIILPLHLISLSGQFGEIPESFSLRGTHGTAHPNPCSRQARSEQVPQSRAQAYLVLKASKDGEPTV